MAPSPTPTTSALPAYTGSPKTYVQQILLLLRGHSRALRLKPAPATIRVVKPGATITCAGQKFAATGPNTQTFEWCGEKSGFALAEQQIDNTAANDPTLVLPVLVQRYAAAVATVNRLKTRPENAAPDCVAGGLVRQMTAQGMLTPTATDQMRSYFKYLGQMKWFSKGEKSGTPTCLKALR